MHEMPVNDMYNDDVRIRPDGRVLHKMFLMQVKSPAESKVKYDDYQAPRRDSGQSGFPADGGGPVPLSQEGIAGKSDDLVGG